MPHHLQLHPSLREIDEDNKEENNSDEVYYVAAYSNVFKKLNMKRFARTIVFFSRLAYLMIGW
jgi:hypothetical protein